MKLYVVLYREPGTLPYEDPEQWSWRLQFQAAKKHNYFHADTLITTVEGLRSAAQAEKHALKWLTRLGVNPGVVAFREEKQDAAA